MMPHRFIAIVLIGVGLVQGKPLFGALGGGSFGDYLEGANNRDQRSGFSKNLDVSQSSTFGSLQKTAIHTEDAPAIEHLSDSEGFERTDLGFQQSTKGVSHEIARGHYGLDPSLPGFEGSSESISRTTHSQRGDPELTRFARQGSASKSEATQTTQIAQEGGLNLDPVGRWGGATQQVEKTVQVYSSASEPNLGGLVGESLGGLQSPFPNGGGFDSVTQISGGQETFRQGADPAGSAFKPSLGEFRGASKSEATQNTHIAQEGGLDIDAPNVGRWGGATQQVEKTEKTVQRYSSASEPNFGGLQSPFPNGGGFDSVTQISGGQETFSQGGSPAGSAFNPSLAGLGSASESEATRTTQVTQEGGLDLDRRTPNVKRWGGATQQVRKTAQGYSSVSEPNFAGFGSEGLGGLQSPFLNEGGFDTQASEGQQRLRQGADLGSFSFRFQCQSTGKCLQATQAKQFGQVGGLNWGGSGHGHVHGALKSPFMNTGGFGSVKQQAESVPGFQHRGVVFEPNFGGWESQQGSGHSQRVQTDQRLGQGTASGGHVIPKSGSSSFGGYANGGASGLNETAGSTTGGLGSQISRVLPALGFPSIKTFL